MLAIIMKWIPWSGKSTYVRDSLQWYTVISKDIIRASWLFKKEDLVRDEEARQIKKSASELSDIVIDNTHMNINTLNSTIKLCQWLWYDVEVKDMCDSWWDCYICYLNESLRRNKNKDACVPSSVIHEMYLSCYPIDRQYYIFDIDWTIAEMNEDRRWYLHNKDYDSFYWKSVLEDKPILPTLNILHDLSSDYNIVLVSWRSNKSCEYTEQRLNNNDIKHNHILMRNDYDHRPDWIIKKELYQKCLEWQPRKCLWVFDDREQVMKMRRDKWLFVFDVSQWNRDF